MNSAKDEFLARTPVGRDVGWCPAQHLPPPSTWLTGSCSTTFAVAAPLAEAVASCRCLPTNKITRSFPLPVQRVGGAAEEMSKCCPWAAARRHAGVRRDRYDFFPCGINLYCLHYSWFMEQAVEVYIHASMQRNTYTLENTYLHAGILIHT